MPARSWPLELYAEARRLFETTNTSAEEISRQIGGSKSRNAVIGISHRDGWSRSVRYKPHLSTPRKRAPVGLKRSKAVQVALQPQIAPMPRYAGPVGGKTLFELLPTDCRWPSGDRDFRFCAGQAENGRPYCALHCKMAYRPAG